MPTRVSLTLGNFKTTIGRFPEILSGSSPETQKAPNCSLGYYEIAGLAGSAKPTS